MLLGLPTKIMTSCMGQNKEKILSLSLLHTKIPKKNLTYLRWFFAGVFWTKRVIQGWSCLRHYVVVYSCCTLSCLITYVLKRQLKWHSALAMHKGARYKTARVPVRILSRVLRLRAAPSWCVVREGSTSAASPVIPAPSWIPTTRSLHRRAHRRRLLGMGYRPSAEPSKIREICYPISRYYALNSSLCKVKLFFKFSKLQIFRHTHTDTHIHTLMYIY